MINAFLKQVFSSRTAAAAGSEVFESHRLIFSCNGHEIELCSNQDGVTVEIKRAEPAELLTDCGIDWPETAAANDKGAA